MLPRLKAHETEKVKGCSNIYVAPLLPRYSLATLAKRTQIFKAQIFSRKKK
jgi:hypothetical protein